MDDAARLLQLYMDMLSDRKKVAQALVDGIMHLQKVAAGTTRMIAELDDPKTKVSPEKAVTVLTKAVNLLAQSQVQALTILTAYISGDNFSSDCAHILTNNGRGREALQQMLRNKMGL